MVQVWSRSVSGAGKSVKNFSQPEGKNSLICKKKVSVFKGFIFLCKGVFTNGIDLECTITWTSLSTLVIKSELECAAEVKLHKTNPRRQPLHIHNQWLTYIFPQLAISYNYLALGMMRALQSSSPKQSSLFWFFVILFPSDSQHLTSLIKTVQSDELKGTLWTLTCDLTLFPSRLTLIAFLLISKSTHDTVKDILLQYCDCTIASATAL